MRTKLSFLVCLLALWGLIGVGNAAAATEHTVAFQAVDADPVKPGIQVRVKQMLMDGATFLFTVGSSGISAGGRMVIQIPQGWSQPDTGTPYSGFVRATNTGGATLLTATSGQYIIMAVAAGPGLSAGNTVSVYYHMPVTQYTTQDNIFFPVQVKETVLSELKPLAMSTVIDVVAGDPYNVTFEYGNLGSPSVRKGYVGSRPIQVKVVDASWAVTQATAPITVSLAGWTQSYDAATSMYTFNEDPTACFYSDSLGAHQITELVIPAGRSIGEFYYKTDAGTVNTIVRISNSINPSWTTDMWVQVMSGGIANARIHKGDNATTKSISLQPGENASIDFDITSTDTNLNWQVLVATSADRSFGVWTYWSYGVPYQGQVTWDGRFNYHDTVNNVGHWGEYAPNGTYYVRIQMGNGAVMDDTLSLTIQSIEIKGRVTDQAGAGIANASVSASGQVWSQARTDAGGYYSIGGLKAGSYHMTVQAEGYAQKNQNNVAAGSTGVNFALEKPAYLKINARRGLSADSHVVSPESWGGVQIYTRSTNGAMESSNNYWGSLHFDVGVSTSDNGQWTMTSTARYEIDNSTVNSYDAGRWTYIAVAPGTYELNANISGYDSIKKSAITVAVGEVREISDLLFPLKKVTYGTVKLPAGYTPTDYWGTWVSVEAVPEGQSNGIAWGGTNIQQGTSSGTYTLYGLAAGNYTLRTFAPGLKRAAVAFAMPAEGDTHRAPDIQLETGGGITGTVTVAGDTTDASLGFPGDSFTVYLNAWSPDSYSYGWTQVPMIKSVTGASASYALTGLDDGTYWLSSWLNGFELDGSVGGNGVKATVANGVGAMNLTFRRYSGSIKIAFSVPNNDYANTSVTLMGGTFYNSVWQSGVALTDAAQYGASFDAATGILTTPPLGTGFYQARGTYQGTGLTLAKTAMVVNGQSRRIEMNLTAHTYSISGKVTIKGQLEGGYTNTNFDVLVATIPQITVLKTQNGMTYSSTPNVALLGTVSTTTFRVKAVDYLNKDDSSNRSGSDTMTGGMAGPVTLSGRSGVINPNGTYTISGLVPGMYQLEIPGVELNGKDDGNETARIRKLVVVVDKELTGIDLQVEEGYAISGQVKLPSGETATRSFTMTWLDASSFKYSSSDGAYLGYKEIGFYNAETASFTVRGLAPGNYMVQVVDYGYWDNANNRKVERQYANSSVPVKIESSDVNQDIQLGKGGKITLKLRDVDSGSLITPANKSKMLPQSYMIYANANPWVEGGWAQWQSLSTVSGASSSTTENFELTFLPEALYDVSLGQSTSGSTMMSSTSGSEGSTQQGGNSSSYAAKTMSSISVKNGQATDLGTIDIHQGLTVSGTVRDKAGNGIPNIPVIALPSLTNMFDTNLRGFTDINGKYSIAGLDPDNPYYDVIACPRVDPHMFGDYFFFGSGGISYGEKTTTMIKIRETNSGIDFALEEAKGAVKGTVKTEDGGPLQNFDDPNIPTAMVFMQKEDTFPRTNPIGDIMTTTAMDGTFSIEALPAGTYKLVVLSGGYASCTKEVVVADTEVNAGTLTMKRGAKISGAITKKGVTSADGKAAYPSTTEVDAVVAATDDFSEIIVGTTRKSGDKTVTGYELNGFQPLNAYNIMFMGKENKDDMIPAVLNYSVPYSTYVKTDYDLLYQIAAPSCFTRAKRNGNVYTIYFDVTAALRKAVPDDDDMTKIITVKAGAGTLSELYLAPSRKVMSCVYTAPAGETRFALTISAYVKTLNPDTGREYQLNESFQYYAGIGARNRVRISNMRGGRVTLEGDSSSIQFTAGAFEVQSATSSIDIDFQRADSMDDLTAQVSPQKGAPRLFAIPKPAAAYPENLHGAMQAAQSAGVSPLSAFYDIMLPAGVARNFKKDATLTLQYSQSLDPATLNVYYYDTVNKVYLLENRSRKTDATAKTVSVSINHASIFVILQSNAAVIQGTAYNGPLFVYNYPNPFDLRAKSVSLTNAPAAQMNQSISGTMIHYGLPSDVAGEVEIRIYNVAGELVRTISDGSRTGGSHYYIEWDGRNDDGRKTASGVYIARFTVDKKNEKFFKMAVIK